MSQSVNSRPTLEQLDRELARRKNRRDFKKAVVDTTRVLLVVAAISVLLSTLWLPVFRIYGDSMLPALREGDIVLSVKSGDYDYGQILAFYFNNKILLKRVIAKGGDVVDIAQDGRVTRNGQVLDEPYVDELALGQCDLTFPYNVPQERLFVMGDQRSTSVDSRSSMLGAVSDEQIVGRVFLRVWPLDAFGAVQETLG
jgi:signal peptidase I